MNNQDVVQEIRAELEALTKALSEKELIKKVFTTFPEFKELVDNKVDFKKFTNQFSRLYHHKKEQANLDIYALWFFYDFFQVDEDMIKELKEQKSKLLELQQDIVNGEE